MKYLLLVFLVGCGSVEAARPADGGTDAVPVMGIDAAGGSLGTIADAAPDVQPPDAGTDTKPPTLDAGTDTKPCTPSACIVCVNGIPTTLPGACM